MPPDEERDSRIAFQEAWKMSRKWRGPPGHYLTLVYGAWRGIHSARKRGVTPEGLLRHYARWGVLNCLREEKPLGLSKRQFKAGMAPVEPLGDDVWDLPGRPDDGTDPDLLRLWAEYAPLREDIPMRSRVVAYLRVVEAWSAVEIGAALGVTAEQVRSILRRFTLRVTIHPTSKDARP